MTIQIKGRQNPKDRNKGRRTNRQTDRQTDRKIRERERERNCLKTITETVNMVFMSPVSSVFHTEITVNIGQSSSIHSINKMSMLQA